MRRRTLVFVLAIGGAVVLLGGGGVAAACKLTSLYCGFSEPSPAVDPYSPATGELSLPEGFSSVTAARGLTLPTAFDFLPDGRMLVAEKRGLVRLVENGAVAAKPVLDLRRKVNVQWFRGLVGLAVDPEFAANRYVYVAYSARRPGVAATAPTYVLVSRYALSQDLEPGPERVIIGGDADPVSGCTKLPSSSDCIPSPGDHIGADIAFGGDGTLFVSTGDGGGEERVEQRAFQAQNVDDLGGKVLRVTRDGEGLTTNPFYDGDTAANRARVWATGFRNPFRLTLAPETDLPVVADVGWRAYEEIDTAPAGSNLGWPCLEGDSETPMYADTAQCAEILSALDDLRAPAVVLERAGATASITGGVFYTGTRYPEEYRRYFFGDWAKGWIRHVAIEPVTGEADEPVDFAENAGGPVGFRVGPDGLLYVLSLNCGCAIRIEYEG